MNDIITAIESENYNTITRKSLELSTLIQLRVEQFEKMEKKSK